jgi:hypothetical protein
MKYLSMLILSFILMVTLAAGAEQSIKSDSPYKRVRHTAQCCKCCVDLNQERCGYVTVRRCRALGGYCINHTILPCSR